MLSIKPCQHMRRCFQKQQQPRISGRGISWIGISNSEQITSVSSDIIYMQYSKLFGSWLVFRVQHYLQGWQWGGECRGSYFPSPSPFPIPHPHFPLLIPIPIGEQFYNPIPIPNVDRGSYRDSGIFHPYQVNIKTIQTQKNIRNQTHKVS